MDDLVLTTKQIVERLNKGDYEELGDFLQAIDWTQVTPKTIIPKSVLRKFVRSISDKDRRIAVMEFLNKFAQDFFFDGAYDMAYKSIEQDNEGLEEYEIEDYARDDANDAIRNFKAELNFQIDLVKSKEAPAIVFDQLKRKKNDLEKEVKDLKEENKKLTSKLDLYEHPFRHALFIPKELQEEEFMHIMKYLQSKQIVMPYQDRDEYGLPQVACYQWCGDSKALFGYFADRVSFELDLYKNGHVQWKIFKPAFMNFKDVEKQAKDVISKYKSFTDPQVPLPKGYEIIDAAVEYAEEKCNHDLDKPAAKTREVIESR